MRLELSRRAKSDLDSVRDYSVDNFGVDRAIAYIDAMEQVFRRLLSFPEIGAPHPALQDGVRSLSCQQHRIFYVIDGKTIRVLRILHHAMDTARLL
jgi:toxin ParE1/3/4